MKVEIILNNGKHVNRTVSNAYKEPMGSKLIDLKAIADAIFLIEDVLCKNANIRAIHIPLYNTYPSSLNSTIEELIEFLFNRSINIVFVKNPQTHLINMDDSFSDGVTCLFSGGLDSFSGILNSKKKYGEVAGAFTRHADQRNLMPLIQKLKKDVLGKHGINVTTIDAAKNGNYTRLTRGALYTLNALLTKNRNIVISEVGPTMFQPSFTLLDDVSFTTHPRVIEFSKKIAEDVLHEKISIIKPNENLTKSEVATASPEKDYIKRTCSCRTMRFCNSDKPNGDTCYGCMIRRLALLVAEIKDSKYRKDILVSKDSGRDQYDNILPLLHFSSKVLTDFDDIPQYTSKLIKEYKKEKVFERFALDNFAGLLILEEHGKLSDKIFQKALTNLLKEIPRERLHDRIEAVRNNEYKPDFNNKI